MNVSRKSNSKRRRYSVTSLVTYEVCPFQYLQTYVHKIPRPRTRAMMRGLNVHSLISRHYRAQPLAEPIESDEFALFARFRESRFNVPPLASEKSFVLPLPLGDVSGRIDVVLPGPDGSIELVDFKTGVAPDTGSLDQNLQLPLYAVAAQRIFDVAAEETFYTYFFLGSDTEMRFSVSEKSQDEVVGRVAGIMTNIQAGHFDPAPGCECFACTRRFE